MIKHLHPFPARMAPEVVFDALPDHGEADVLDPMMGSGTTLVSARAKGHRATGVDSDPLAVLIARVATRDLDTDIFKSEAAALLRRAEELAGQLQDKKAYPLSADEETKDFIDYWFDGRSRKQLAAFAYALDERQYRTKAFLKCAISRMIITKQGGVSLAEDISHSRPHRTRNCAPIPPFKLFSRSVTTIVANARFTKGMYLPKARILTGDARALPFGDHSFDYIVTSPPYLNAIDYLRGHKLSLVWFGHSIAELRRLRSTNVGSSRGIKLDANDAIIGRMVQDVGVLPTKMLNMLRLYVHDLSKSVGEMARVLRPGGTVFFVIGDCDIRGIAVKNSEAISLIAEGCGLRRIAADIRRPLPMNKRYLPPPKAARGTSPLANRMREEVISSFRSA